MQFEVPSLRSNPSNHRQESAQENPGANRKGWIPCACAATTAFSSRVPQLPISPSSSFPLLLVARSCSASTRGSPGSHSWQVASCHPLLPPPTLSDWDEATRRDDGWRQAVGVSSFGEVRWGGRWGEAWGEQSCMPPSFLWEWDARAEQNRGSLAGRSVPATPQPLTRGAGAGQPSRDSLRMSCDCDARGGRETPRQTVFNSQWWWGTNERWGRRVDPLKSAPVHGCLLIVWWLYCFFRHWICHSLPVYSLYIYI